MSCGFFGNLNSVHFQNHVIDEEHCFCMRIHEPYELFCSFCGDYQYSSKFDELIGYKRRLFPIEKEDNNQVTVKAKLEGTKVNSIKIPLLSISKHITKPFKTRGICKLLYFYFYM